jgi:hypothetical protein
MGGSGRVANESRDRGIKFPEQKEDGAGPFSRERRARCLHQGADGAPLDTTPYATRGKPRAKENKRPGGGECLVRSGAES